MTFLELVNRARLEGDTSGADLTTLGGTLSRESTRFKTWVAEAWNEVQTLHDDWGWMRKSFSFDTVASVATYTPTGGAGVGAGLSDFANWKRDTFRLYTTSIGQNDEQILPFQDYETFRNLYQYATMRTTDQRPAVFTIDPNKNLIFGARPNAVFTCVGDYYAKPTQLVADTDTLTLLPERFHMLVVWRALLNYGEFEAAAEVMRRAERNLLRLQSALEAEYLPQMGFGPPLA